MREAIENELTTFNRCGEGALMPHQSISGPQCCAPAQLSPQSSPYRGLGGPHDAGSYNSYIWDTGFFRSQGGSWDSEYGDFFLSWYSNRLIRHADEVLAVAAAALHGSSRPESPRGVKQALSRLARLVQVHAPCGSAATLCARRAILIIRVLALPQPKTQHSLCVTPCFPPGCGP